MDQSTSRRQFLQQATALAVGTRLVGAPRARAQAKPEKLGVAVIGAGGMGGYAVGAGLNERLVAVCEIDDGRMGDIMKKTVQPKLNGRPEPKVYYDYRKLLDECAKDIDVVLISTPDHHHAPAAMRAIKLGKAVFAQKPLGHNIRECYELAKAAKEAKVATQMGNQGHCSETMRRACESIWDGVVGKITETHTLLGRNFGGSGKRPASKPVPAGLHWDEWIGPAAFRDYHDGLHPFSWRSWRAFGTGTIGDMACHNLDIMFFALKIAEAKTFTVECLGTKGGSEEMWATDNVVRYVIPARGEMPELTAYVYDHGGLKPEVMKETEKEHTLKFGEDTLYLGDKGRMYTTGTAGSMRLLPLERNKEYKFPAPILPRAKGGPIEDLFHAVKTGGTPVSNFVDAAGPLTAFALCGHLAQIAGVGKKVEWNVEKMECTNLPELNKHVRREYRPGWEV